LPELSPADPRVPRTWLASSLIVGAVLVLICWEAHGHTLQRDTRSVRDRLHAWNNPDHQDYSFLNGVGAVWPEDFGKSAVPYDASSGFLLDRCHVLTTLHAVYTDDVVVQAMPGKAVSFGVGQTASDSDRGAARGLRFLLHGIVVATGETTIVAHVVQHPDADWAVIQLRTNVDDSIAELSVIAPTLAQLRPGTGVAAAGFPADHRALRADGFNFKDLWGATGILVEVRPMTTVGAIATTTVQATRGMSGGPLYLSLPREPHAVIGMVQSISGNGIDVSPQAPNVELLFTPALLKEITGIVAHTPCG